MKVLFIVTAYPRWPGDVITPWLVETIERLRGRGVEVEVLAPSYRGLGSGVRDGVMVHRFRYAPAALETLTHDQTAPDRVRERRAYLGLVPGYVAAGTLAAVRLARSGGFDVMHAFWPLPHGLLGLAARRAAGVPLVCTFFGVELRWLQSELGLLRPVVRRIVRGSDAVTVISSHTAAEVRAVAPEASVRVIPFGAATPDEAIPPPRMRHPGEPMRLLFIGRLVERKGVGVLLEALARGGAGDRLTIVGDGPLRPELEAQARRAGLAGRVDFAGAVPAAALSARLAEADALVLPAVRDAKGDVEGLGVVLIEALSAERPVIASASGGIVDIVRDGDTGLLVPPGDAGALASAIARYREDPRLAADLAARGRAFVEAEFSWTGILDRLVETYQVLASQRRGGSGGRRSE